MEGVNAEALAFSELSLQGTVRLETGVGLGLGPVTALHALLALLGVTGTEEEDRIGVILRDIEGEFPWRRSASLPRGALTTDDKRG
jgi:hypothetical protein